MPDELEIARSVGFQEGFTDGYKASEQAEQDAGRFEWWFSDTNKGSFINTYLQGVREGWGTDQWRAAIDAAMKTPPSEGKE